MPPAQRPYADITVINASRGLAGATAAQLIAGLGARVIRVEEPPAGREHTSPSRGALAGWDRDGDLFAHFGRGSQSVVLDLDRPEGVDALRRLASRAQVVIEDERPADERGVRAALRAVREDGARFTLASITPFGLSGPWMDFPSSELIIFATSGLMAHVGEPDREPVTLPAWLVQGHVGLATFSAIASSLPIGGGEVQSHNLDIAQLDVIANSNPHAISGHSYTGAIETRQGSRFLDGYPWTVLPCKDGFIGIIAPQVRWDVFCIWMERVDLIEDPRFKDRLARRQHPDELDEIMIAWTMGMTKEELYRGGQERQLPFGAVFTIPDSLGSQQLAERKFFDEARMPSGETRKFAGLPYVINGERPTLGALPALGEHTNSVLSELGVSPAASERGAS